MRERVTGSGGDLRKATGALKQIRMKIDYRTGLVDTFGVMAVVVVGEVLVLRIIVVFKEMVEVVEMVESVLQQMETLVI